VADVSDRQQLAAVLGDTLDRLGPVDIVVNNAGRWTYAAFVDSDPQAWATDIGINLLGVMNTCHILLPQMIERNYGRVINVVSDSGRVGEPNVAPYAAAKAGVMGFARSLAKEVGREGITVNCVSLSTTLTPGALETFTSAQLDKMTRRYPVGRLGQPEDAAEAVAYFASPAASWVTGQTLSVNGGYAML
jgi:NAD(P)-dependent dehydrogenase (short-subunit alcohol dehydrogenase family)